MMRIEPVKYKKFVRDPIGRFSAVMADNGWTESRYENNSRRVLFSSEVGEFSRLIYQFFKDCPDWDALQKYLRKFGTKTLNDQGVSVTAINFIGSEMDYTLILNGVYLTAFPYEKITH